MPEIVWQPQPGPQKALIDCPLPEIFYGGARGGGKTEGVLGKYAIKSGMYGKNFNAVIFRREVPQADDLVERGNDIYLKLGAKFMAQHKTWRFPSGGRIRVRPLERIEDAEKYQGQNLTDVAIEEAGNYPDPAPIDRMHGALRSAFGVPTQMILTGNPGGPGQNWIKDRYIDPAPAGMKLLTRLLPNDAVHKYIYIPSRVTDNQVMLKNDPEYINRLYLVGSEALVKAWLEGDFNAVEGAFFECWSTEKHVIPPLELPRHWLRFRAMDWGSAAPFCVQWWAIASEDLTWTDQGVTRTIPKNAMVCYREWYGASKPNVGLKLTAEEVARGIGFLLFLSRVYSIYHWPVLVGVCQSLLTLRSPVSHTKLPSALSSSLDGNPRCSLSSSSRPCLAARLHMRLILYASIQIIMLSYSLRHHVDNDERDASNEDDAPCASHRMSLLLSHSAGS